MTLATALMYFLFAFAVFCAALAAAVSTAAWKVLFSAVVLAMEMATSIASFRAALASFAALSASMLVWSTLALASARVAVLIMLSLFMSCLWVLVLGGGRLDLSLLFLRLLAWHLP